MMRTRCDEAMVTTGGLYTRHMQCRMVAASENEQAFHNKCDSGFGFLCYGDCKGVVISVDGL